MSELSELIETSLGYPLDQPTLTACEQIQAQEWELHDKLNEQLDAGTLSPDNYLTRFTELVQTAMQSLLAVLGDEKFDIIFGEAGRHPEGMIDREMFLKSLRDAGST